MGGLTSCLSVILHEVTQHHGRHGSYPAKVDASASFTTCKDNRQQDLAAMLLEPSRHYTGPAVPFDHGHQYARYQLLPIEALSEVARHYAWPSSRVGDTAYTLLQQVGGRTAVIYRGNDKVTERPRTPYAAMIATAAMAGGPYVVLTDELDFFEAFADAFPNTIAMPGSTMIPRNDARVVTGDSRFAIHFLAALYAASQAPKLVTTTGNTGLWPVIWRGNCREVYQV
jgi:hypothetical protein